MPPSFVVNLGINKLHTFNPIFFFNGKQRRLEKEHDQECELGELSNASNYKKTSSGNSINEKMLKYLK